MIPCQTSCTLNPRFPISIILEVSLTSFAGVAGRCCFFPLVLPSYCGFFNFSGWKTTMDLIVAIRAHRCRRHVVKYSSSLCCAFSLLDPRELLWSRHQTRRYCDVICTKQCSRMIDIFRQCIFRERVDSCGLEELQMLLIVMFSWKTEWKLRKSLFLKVYAIYLQKIFDLSPVRFHGAKNGDIERLKQMCGVHWKSEKH